MVSSLSCSSGFGGSSTPWNNVTNWSMDCVGKPIGSHAVSWDGCVTVTGVSASGVVFSLKVYANNPLNRHLGRVGLPLGTCVLHKDGSVTRSSYIRTYVDNAQNRKLGRVGLPIGACVLHKDGSTVNELSFFFFAINVKMALV